MPSEWTLYFLLFLFSYALILFDFENRRFSLYFLQLGKPLSFVAKTEGYLKQQSFRKLQFSSKPEEIQKIGIQLYFS